MQEAKMSVRDAFHDGKTLVIRSSDGNQNRKRKVGEFVKGNEGNKFGATSTETSQDTKHLRESRLTPGPKKPAQKTLNKYFTNVLSSKGYFSFANAA